MKIILFCQENLKFVQFGLIALPILLVLTIMSLVLCGNPSKEEKNGLVGISQLINFKNFGNFATSLFFFGIFFISGVAASSKCLKLGTLI